HLAPLRALFSAVALAGDTDFGGEWHINDQPPGHTDLRGDARSLGADPPLDDLADSASAALHRVRDAWHRPPGRARAPDPPTAPGQPTAGRDPTIVPARTHAKQIG